MHTSEASSTPLTTNFQHFGSMDHRKQGSPLDMATHLTKNNCSHTSDSV